jgi:hypothetical protein
LMPQRAGAPKVPGVPAWRIIACEIVRFGSASTG